ncbi:hypothetical protein SAMN04487951_1263 [Vreelandella arcis]|uniref:Uncharacterized protein n=1 Tax=Vreelandella arcis TaxID=416873 RepID=A0A1H0JD58_9GAMM|nr:hypothetical protein SAMN04487951_1263 [Halomonas arcis]
MGHPPTAIITRLKSSKETLKRQRRHFLSIPICIATDHFVSWMNTKEDKKGSHLAAFIKSNL